MIGEDRHLIARFLEMMVAESGAARNTLLAYGSDLEAASVLLEGQLATAGVADLVRLAGTRGIAN